MVHDSEQMIHDAVRGAGFVQDVRRMNVGITRARCALWVLGNAATLSVSEEWGALFSDAATRDAGGCLVQNADAADLFPDLPLWDGPDAPQFQPNSLSNSRPGSPGRYEAPGASLVQGASLLQGGLMGHGAPRPPPGPPPGLAAALGALPEHASPRRNGVLPGSTLPAAPPGFERPAAPATDPRVNRSKPPQDPRKPRL